eukprot:TRINITY_DN1704_c0_g1_i1.p1 TRINITY_DN1704_c0_g1~~TRINITY_DN1704_c0_g1_i1.p1  ORF type:complete len:237 (-),score=69.82 TRINITY_DN1704_c0_g1_i1:148-858(-)
MSTTEKANEIISTGTYDAEQIRLMEERVILLDENDNVIGHESKKNSHLVETIRQGMLHRAFSVFLFNEKNELLLQKRAAEKITFPDMWTNTCCSHPLHVPEELESANALGVKRAAVRKLEHELGIKPSDIPVEAYTYMTRIHYLACSDGLWGEHEIDYVLIAKKNVELNVNPNEISEVKYVNAQELKAMFEQSDRGEIKLTPWFKIIARKFLFDWWKDLENLEQFFDHERIHKLEA